MEVGIEDCLHIEFEYNKSRYHLRDTVVGKIYFLLVRRLSGPNRYDCLGIAQSHTYPFTVLSISQRHCIQRSLDARGCAKILAACLVDASVLSLLLRDAFVPARTLKPTRGRRCV